MIFIIEDDQTFAGCIKRYLGKRESKIFSNVIDAISHIDEKIPDLIFLDIMLTGPNGFTLLNELASYPDTAKIPVVIVSSLDFQNIDLSIYGVVGILNKDNLTPEEITDYVKRYSH